MRILAIDPGTNITGWVVYDTNKHSVPEFSITDNLEFRTNILEEIEEAFKFHGHVPITSYDVVCIEMVASYGMPVGREVFETVLFIGRLYEIFKQYNIPVEFVYRKEVKQALCGSLRAKDANIRQAVLDRFPRSGGGSVPQVGTKKDPGPLYGVKSHIWAALALALTFGIKKGWVDG